MTPTVSVIIPTYNRAAVVSDAVESALAQTYEVLEVIVIDDGSDDDTESVVASFAEEHVRYDRIPHSGPSVARNRGIELARGQIIAFLDSDDVWYPTKIERQLDLFDDPEVGWTYTNLDYEGPDGPEPNRFERVEPCRGWVIRSLFLRGCPMLTTSVMVRRSCLDRVGLFDPELLRWQDNDLYFRLARYYKVDYLDEPLGRYWHRPRIKSTSHVLASRRRHRTVKRRAIELDPGLCSCTAEEMRIAFLNNVVALGRLEAVLGRPAEARRHFRECLAFQPLWWKPLVGYGISYLPAALAGRILGAKIERRDSATQQPANARVVAQHRTDKTAQPLGQ